MKGELTPVAGLKAELERLRRRLKRLQAADARRKQAEATLRFTQFAAEHSPDPTFWIQKDARIIYVNAAACHLLGYSREELLQLRLTDIDPDYPAEKWAAHWADFRCRGGGTLVTHHRAKDGRLIPVEIRAAHLEFDGHEYHCSHARDLRERYQAEAALRESEELYRRLVETSPDAITLTDLNGNLLATNARMPHLHGFADLAELQRLGWNAFDLLAEADRPRALENARRTLELGVLSGLEYQGRRRDGSTFPLEISAAVVRDAAGEPKAFMAVSRDVTERKRAEAALKASEQRYRRLIETANVMVVGLDPAGRINVFNPAAEELTGYRRDEVEGRNWFETLVPRDRFPEVWESFQAGPIRGVARAGENPIVTKSGEERLIIWQNSDLFEDNRWAGTISFGLDVTDQRRAEQARRESEVKYRRLYESMTDASATTDLAGRILDSNPAFQQLLGYTEAELAELTYRDLTPETWHAMESRILAEQVLPRGHSEVYEKEYRRKDGVVFPVELRAFLLRDAQGRPSAMWAIVRDIRQRRRAEAERHALETRMQQAQKLESLGILAGGIAHDFNNLLTAILGHAGLALAHLPPESPARPNLEGIENASHRAAELCRQMLAYSGRGRFVIEPLNLSRLVQELTHLLRVSISKKATLRSHFADPLPAIEADAAQVRQVVMNLVLNASEAIGEREGIIAVSTGVRDCDAAFFRESCLAEDVRPGTCVFLEVADTGCGMNAETQAKIFDPFFTTKFTGRGLGLAAVLGIMRSHKGGIKVQSKPGEGATFTVLFPASPQAAEPAARSASAGPPHGQGTVLLVDDEESVREVAQMILEHCGYQVVPAADGLEAVKLYRARGSEIDCVLLDLTMPRLDGEETHRELRRLDPGVRVILTSGYSEQELADRFAGLGLAGFIQKPFEVKTLGDKVREVLAQPRLPRGT